MRIKISSQLILAFLVQFFLYSQPIFASLKCAELFSSQREIVKSPIVKFLKNILTQNSCCASLESTEASSLKTDRQPYVAGKMDVPSVVPVSTSFFKLIKPKMLKGRVNSNLKFQFEKNIDHQLNEFLQQNPRFELTGAIRYGGLTKVFFLKDKNSNGDQATHVVKFRNFSKQSDEMLHEKVLFREIALEQILQEMTDSAYFNGQKFIHVAKDETSESDIEKGHRIQEAVHGPTAYDLKQALVKVRLGQRFHTNEDLNLIKNAGFDPTSVDSLKLLARYITSLEMFYQQTHDDVIAFSSLNGLQMLVNHLSTQKTHLLIGFDFNFGRNAIWDSNRQGWVIIDY